MNIYLTDENYFSPEANAVYMSVSQFKSFRKCELFGLRESLGLYQRPATVSLMVGSYCDAHFEAKLDIFKAQHPEIMKRDGTLKAEYKQADEIIQRIERDPLFMEYMSGAKQVIMTGEIDGIPVKIKIDSLLPDKIVDLKIMRDFQRVYVPEEGKLNFIEAWGYHFQGAVYQEIVRQNTGKVLPFYIAAATKETVPDIGIFEVPQSVLEPALAMFRQDSPKFQAIKQGYLDPEPCGHCEVCKESKEIKRPTTWEELNETWL